jgi:hypothetical protein
MVTDFSAQFISLIYKDQTVQDCLTVLTLRMRPINRLETSVTERGIRFPRQQKNFLLRIQVFWFVTLSSDISKARTVFTFFRKCRQSIYLNRQHQSYEYVKSYFLISEKCQDQRLATPSHLFNNCQRVLSTRLGRQER